MEWYAFGVDKILMFLLAGTSFLAIILTIMFCIIIVGEKTNIMTPSIKLTTRRYAVHGRARSTGLL